MNILHLPPPPAGHKTFLGFLYMDYCYNHPVLHVFSHVLENSVHKDRGKDEEEGNVELVEADEFEKRNARSKSHLSDLMMIGVGLH